MQLWCNMQLLHMDTKYYILNPQIDIDKKTVSIVNRFRSEGFLYLSFWARRYTWNNECIMINLQHVDIYVKCIF